MTPTQKSEVLSYYGCPFFLDIVWKTGISGADLTPGYTEDWNLLLSAMADRRVDWSKTNIRLCLKSLARLTDDELTSLFRLAYSNKEPQIKHWKKVGVIEMVNYEDTGHVRVDARLWINTGHMGFCGTNEHGIFFPPANVGAFVRGLQQSGYFIPGTVDEKYVELG